MSKKFFAIVGTNGAGIYSSWEKAKVAMEYLNKSIAKGHDTFEAAKDYAIGEFVNRSGRFYLGPFVRNFTLFINDMEKIESKGLDPALEATVSFKNGKKTFKTKGKK